MCKDGKHKSPPEDVEFEFDKEGNLTTGEPSWDTCCPVSCQQLITKLHRGRPVRLYSKWGEKRKQPCKDSHPNPTNLANRWFQAQGVQSAPFDTNAGRKSLAKWCSIGEEDEVDVPYHESFQIHGDLFKVWRGSYQPSCRNPAGFKGREQSNIQSRTLKENNLRKCRSKNPCSGWSGLFVPCAHTPIN